MATKKLEIKPGSFMEWNTEARVMYEEFTETWSVENARKYVDCHESYFKNEIVASDGWAVLSNIEGYKPSDIAGAIIGERMPWALKHKMKHAAIVSTNPVVKIQLKEMAKDAKKMGFKQELFPNVEKAKEWLRKEGYAI